jgi:hypothetical protein
MYKTMKITKYLLVLVSFIIIFSCKDDETVEPFDHAGQAIKDDEFLQTFLQTHFYTPPEDGEHFGKVDTILAGETPLLSQVTTQNLNFGDIDFKMYYLKVMPEGVGENPSKVDSALVNYKGLLLDKVNGEERTEFDSNSYYSFWANLYGGVIPAWTYGIPNFKPGILIPHEDAPFEYNNTGKGIIFVPSGLAYREIGTASIPNSAPLMFHIELARIKRNNQDNDGILSIYEDIDNDDDYLNDDTDDDGTANMIDPDDDGDFLLTRFENADPNEDGNPNDAVDSDGDLIPDYLDDDDDNDGILTIHENADPNHDGNPDDAEDGDGDNIPDYLDNN